MIVIVAMAVMIGGDMLPAAMKMTTAVAATDMAGGLAIPVVMPKQRVVAGMSGAMTVTMMIAAVPQVANMTTTEAAITMMMIAAVTVDGMAIHEVTPKHLDAAGKDAATKAIMMIAAPQAATATGMTRTDATAVAGATAVGLAIPKAMHKRRGAAGTNAAMTTIDTAAVKPLCLNSITKRCLVEAVT